jgi:hypothetical protein
MAAFCRQLLRAQASMTMAIATTIVQPSNQSISVQESKKRSAPKVSHSSSARNIAAATISTTSIISL